MVNTIDGIKELLQGGNTMALNHDSALIADEDGDIVAEFDITTDEMRELLPYAHITTD